MVHLTVILFIDVDSMLFERYERQMDVEATLCFLTSKVIFPGIKQEVVLTSIQCFLNVMNVRWTLKQRSVFTGKGISFWYHL